MNIPIFDWKATFTAAGINEEFTVATQVFPSKISLQVTGFNADGSVAVTPTSWDVAVEGSLNGSAWGNNAPVLEHKDATNSNGDTIDTGPNYKPRRYYRLNCISLTLGAAAYIEVRALGMA